MHRLFFTEQDERGEKSMMSEFRKLDQHAAKVMPVKIEVEKFNFF